MRFTDVQASLTYELVDMTDGDDHRAQSGHGVKITSIKDCGSEGYPMVRVRGTIPALILWLRVECEEPDEDILSLFIPRFALGE